MKHPEISYHKVESGLQSIPRRDYVKKYNEILKKHSNLDDDTDYVLPEEQTDTIFTFRLGHAVTTKGLSGSKRSLSSRSLISYQDFSIPEKITESNVEKMKYNREVAKIAFSMITMYRPHLFSTRTDVEKYVFTNDGTEHEFSYIVGIAKILNGNVETSERQEALLTGFAETQLMLGQIAHDEAAYVDAVLDGVYKKYNHLDPNG